MKPQTRAVLRALEQGHTLTPMEALRDLGVGRLSARIKELRDLGYPIETERVTVPTRGGGAVVARYRLVGREVAA
ncbi:helix-turn-helix domain-containing protein [Deferrisoma camini]|uniref:helix-turn-helix domain-containing protein n=1 Tax=Deferrisoma camini TaxID=1035120 RepID=UPI00046CE2A5|nr:helix-turn-helix domain-containing protein [Deferrisoma camini]